MAEADPDPEVIVDFEFERGLLFVVVRNLGDRPALDVKVEFDKPFKGLGGAREMNRLALFERIRFLAPGKEIRTLLDSSSAYFARKEPTLLTATVSYRTAAAAKRGSRLDHPRPLDLPRPRLRPGRRAPMPDRQPYRTFNFRVEIDGIGEAQFAEVVVPEAEIAVVEYREGADKTSATRKLPGRVSYGNIVLKRGITADLSLYQWFRAVANGRLPAARRRDRPPRRRAAAGAPLDRAGRVADEVRRFRP